MTRTRPSGPTSEDSGSEPTVLIVLIVIVALLVLLGVCFCAYKYSGNTFKSILIGKYPVLTCLSCVKTEETSRRMALNRNRKRRNGASTVIMPLPPSESEEKDVLFISREGVMIPAKLSPTVESNHEVPAGPASLQSI